MKDGIKIVLKKVLLAIGSVYRIKNVIVFESHADYTDNSRAFYEYLVKNGYNKKYKVYWFVNDSKSFKDKEAENVKFLTMWKSGRKKTFFQWIKYFWITKNAKYLLFSNRNLIKINRKTKTVWLNHGIPIKSVKERRQVSGDLDYRVDASEFCVELEMEQNGLRRERFLIVGNPRNDVIFTKTDIEEKMKDFEKFDKIIFWLPTFRKSNSTNRVDSDFDFPLGLPIIYDEKALRRVNAFLKKKNIALILKLHPAQDLSIFKASSLSNMIIIDDDYLIRRDTELTEFYKMTDALITDYSSVYVDYLLTGKPIGFTQDDMESYKIGFSVKNIQDYMPGQKIMNVDDLEQFIDNISNGIDDYEKERRRVCKLFNKFEDSKSSERLVKRLGL